MKLILTRHGETLFNTKGIVQGYCDSPLTINGISHSKKLGQKLKEIPIVAIYSSHLNRAIRTAKIIAKEVGYCERKIVIDERISELNTGIEEGEKIEETFKRYPNTLNINSTITIPEAETWVECQTRFNEFIDEISKLYKSDDNVLVVSHSLILGCYLAKLNKIDRLFKLGNNECVVLNYLDNKYKEMNFVE